MDNYNDIELVQLSVGGDARAFEHLVKRHYLSAYQVSYKWCGIKEDAEDIVQEVFVKVARKLKTFGKRSSFKTWLYRITINTAKDFTRKYATKRVYEKAFAVEQGSNNPVPSRDENPDVLLPAALITGRRASTSVFQVPFCYILCILSPDF
jgi:RNA polymerase sigma-70 factor (ECF subfamily)